MFGRAKKRKQLESAEHRLLVIIGAVAQAISDGKMCSIPALRATYDNKLLEQATKIRALGGDPETVLQARNLHYYVEPEMQRQVIDDVRAIIGR